MLHICIKILCKIENIVCGGVSTNPKGLDNCIELISGSWEYRNTLKTERRGHAMWLTPEKKILLIGGKDSLGNISEIDKIRHVQWSCMVPVNLVMVQTWLNHVKSW